MNFSLSRYRLLDPNSDGGGGGGAGADGSGAGGAAGAGAGAGAAGTGTPAPQYVPKADFDRLAQSFSGMSQKFDGFHADYSRRFAPAGGGDNQPEQEPQIEGYESTQAGMQKYIADLNKFHTKQNWTEHEASAKKSQADLLARSKRQASIGEHVKRMGEARVRYKDFDQVVNNAPFSLPDGSNGQPDILGAVLDSEHSGDLQYYLSSPGGQGDLFKLAHAFSQSEGAGSRILGRLEARFEREASERKKNLRQASGAPTADAGGEHDGGGDNESKYEDLARSAWGLKK